MVTDDAALDAVTGGPDGILAGLAPGKVYVDMSSVSPQASAAVAERVRLLGAWMLDAPVSGSIPQAEQGTLAIMVGGDRAAFDRVQPLLAPARPAGHPRRRQRRRGVAETRHQHQPRGADAGLQRGTVARRARRHRPRARRARDGHQLHRLADARRAGTAVARPASRRLVRRRADAQGHPPRPPRRRKHSDLTLPAATATDRELATADQLGYAHRDIAALHEVLDRLNPPAQRDQLADVR